MRTMPLSTPLPDLFPGCSPGEPVGGRASWHIQCNSVSLQFIEQASSDVVSMRIPLFHVPPGSMAAAEAMKNALAINHEMALEDVTTLGFDAATSSFVATTHYPVQTIRERGGIELVEFIAARVLEWKAMLQPHDSPPLDPTGHSFQMLA